MIGLRSGRRLSRPLPVSIRLHTTSRGTSELGSMPNIWAYRSAAYEWGLS